MKDQEFRDDQHARLHEPHIAPITKYADELRETGGWAPYVAPIHGGVDARILCLLRDPGPATQVGSGSGMLCFENDDQTAERQLELMRGAGLSMCDIIPWNAYPWYINKAPTRDQLRKGATTIAHLVGLLPKLQIVLLQGTEAQKGWEYALEEDPTIRYRRLITISTYHPSNQATKQPSNQALRTPSSQERERRIQHRIDSWKAAASALED